MYFEKGVGLTVFHLFVLNRGKGSVIYNLHIVYMGYLHTAFPVLSRSHKITLSSILKTGHFSLFFFVQHAVVTTPTGTFPGMQISLSLVTELTNIF